MSVAVNLSVRQVLAPDIVTQFKDVLCRTGVAPERLCLELTESVFMGDIDYLRQHPGRPEECTGGAGNSLSLGSKWPPASSQRL